MGIHDIIVIGAGPAGITAGVFAVRRSMDVVVLGDPTSMSTIEEATIVDDWPGVPGITGPELMETFRSHAKKLGVPVKPEKAIGIRKKGRNFVVKTEKAEYETRTVIMATGAKHRKAMVPGEKEFAGRGVSYCANCVPPETEVMVNCGLKRIDDIEEGTKVLTHEGNFRHVKGVIKNRYKGTMIRIDTSFFRDTETLVTPNHELLVAEVKRCNSRGTAKSVCKESCNTQNQRCPKHYLDYKPRWIPAARLTKNYMILYPRVRKVEDVKEIRVEELVDSWVDEGGHAHNKEERHTSVSVPNIIPVDNKFMRLAGYYLSEGCITNRGVTFTFNSKENDYIKDSSALIKDLFGIEATITTVGGVTHVHTFSSILLKLFESLFGKYAYNKHIPHWMIYLPEEKQYELVKGMWFGDGCKRKKDFAYVTTSKTLACQLKTLMLRFGIMVTTEKKSVEWQNEHAGVIGGRKIVSKHEKFTVVVKGPHLDKMSGILGIDHDYPSKRNRTMHYSWFDDRFAYVPIKEISQQDYNGFVHNLVVDGDNSYVSGNATLHNCDGPLFRGRKVIVVGGGDTAATYALLLEQMGADTTLVHRRDELRAVDIYRKELAKSKVKFIWNAVLKEIKGEKMVKSVVIQDIKTKETKELPMDGVFIAIGTVPASELVKNIGAQTDAGGFIKVDRKQMTSVPGVFAAGDCSDNCTKRIVTAAAEGSVAAEMAFEFIRAGEL